MKTKSYSIELDEAQVNFLKTRFQCQTDSELRNVLQRIAISLINQQQTTSEDKGDRMTTAVRDERLPLTCDNCGKVFKQAYEIRFKGKLLIVCEKCVRELTGGVK